MRTDVPPPPVDYNGPDAERWGRLTDAETGMEGRAATEAEYRASASVPGGKGTFWGPYGRVVYVDTTKYPANRGER